MNYIAWAKEYEEEAKRIKAHIGTLKTQLQTAQGKQIHLLHSRIYLLYGMYLDCRNTAEILLRYARKKQGSEEDAIG